MRLTAREILLTSLFTAFMAIGAYIVIPFPFLPVTMQPIFCALSGFIAGSKIGSLSMSVYTIIGLAGVPVFTHGGGITYIFNRSFGFILGFILAAYVIGKLSQKSNGSVKKNNMKAAIAGLIIIYTIGIVYMFLIMKLYMKNTEISLLFVLIANLPYFIKDLILFTAAAIISIPIKSSLGRAIH